MADLLCLESLLCNETYNMCFDDTEATDDLDHSLNFDNLVGGRSEPVIGLIPVQSDEVMFRLFEKECDFLPRSDFLQRLTNGELDLRVRNEALDWILKANSYYGFGGLTACLAINYLDRFLSVYEFPKENILNAQLLAVACLSLAAKLEEVKVPLTLDMHQVTHPKFIFQTKIINKMELLVLKTLKWRLQACTPLSFIDYFIRKIKSEDMLPSGSLINKSVQLISNTMKGIDFLEFRPSEISAAVAICITREAHDQDIDKAMSGVIHFKKDRMLKCVRMLKGFGVLDSTCSSFKSDERHVIMDPSSSTSQDMKRRKLD